MAWTAAEITRVEAIEEMLNAIQVAIGNLASKAQMRQLLLIRQTELDNLIARISSLETQIATLQNNLG